MNGAVPSLVEEPDLRVGAPGYSLIVPGGVDRLVDRPFADLVDGEGERWMRLCLLASVHGGSSPARRDETWRIERASVARRPDGAVVVELEQSSTAWESKTVRVTCRADAVELEVSVEGAGPIDRVLLLGGDGGLPTGAAGTFRSSIDVPSLTVPGPTEPVAFARSAHLPAQLGVVGDADPGRLNGIFSPPPFALGLGRAAVGSPVAGDGERWLGLSVRAPIADCGFTTVRWEPLDGGALLALDFEGHTRCEGTWTSPTVVLRPADGAGSVLDDHRADLVGHGMAPMEPPAAPEDWWTEPLFCGWGAQCAAAGDEGAAALSRADAYDRWIGRLAAHAVDPGTVVIDDRWEDVYGSGAPDADRWPDLKGWIAAQHAAGRRVLLWWKAWDPSAAPASECITTPAGDPVAVDPGSPAYRRRLAETIERMLSPEGLGADGLKVDFTQRAPSGASLQRAVDADVSDGAWGAAALHLLLRTIYTAAKTAKSDALVIAHAVHPAFGDCADMIRTNDVLERDLDGRIVPVADQLRARADIVARSLPRHLIDTDQWPMPDRAEWLRYAAAQIDLGVPALYYAESIDNSGEPIEDADLAEIGRLWARYRAGRTPS